MRASADECADDCKPAYLQRRLDSFPPSTIAMSSLPFACTFALVAMVVWGRVFPLLSASQKTSGNGGAAAARRAAAKDNAVCTWSMQDLRFVLVQRMAGLAFSATIALSAVLVELILCEISNTLNPAARALALRITLPALLGFIIVVSPALEIHSWMTSLAQPSSMPVSRRMRPGTQYVLEAVLLGVWLVAFWYMPRTSVLPASLHQQPGHQEQDFGFIEACLERIGIIGISLMASLAGFAAVSSIWQTFGTRHRQVHESDIARKESGAAATREMLATKQSRLRALQRKMSEAPQDTGFMTRMMGTFRSNADSTEQRALELEISGLETMSTALSSSASTLRDRHTTQQRAHTPTGRLLNTFNFIFALYCLYRIAATSLSSLRRWWQPSSTFATSDPINNILALLTTHYDPTLDRAAWSRQISFLLSGVMLLLSFNAVAQTFRLFSRFAPRLVQHTHTHTALPLVTSQIAAAFVVSQALLLRSNLPREVGGVITEALGAPLEVGFVEGWFESWFLVAVGLTAVGVLVGRKIGRESGWEGDEWDDCGGELEMGKMS